MERYTNTNKFTKSIFMEEKLEDNQRKKYKQIYQIHSMKGKLEDIQREKIRKYKHICKINFYEK